MRKLITWFIAALIVLIIIIPFLMGLLVRNEFIKQLGRLNYPGVKIIVLSYDTGCFTSRAQLQIETPVPNALQRLPALTAHPINHFTYLANIRIYHGPVALARMLNHHHHLFFGQSAASGEFHLVTPYLDLSTGLQGLDSPAHLFAVLTLSGKLHLFINHDAIKYFDTTNGILFGTGPIDVKLTLDHAMSKQITGKMSITDLQFAYKTMQIFASHYVMRFIINKISPIWTGQHHIQIDELSVSSNNQQAAKFNQIDLTILRSFEKGKFSAHQTLNIQRLQFSDHVFNELHADLLAQGLNINLLSQAHVSPKWLVGSTYQLKTLTAQSDLGPITLSGIWNMPKILPPKLPASHAFGIFLSSGNGSLQANLPMPTDETSLVAGIISEPGPVLPPGAHFKNPQANMLSVMLYSLYNRGLLKKEGDHLVANLRYQQGELKINKRSINY